MDKTIIIGFVISWLALCLLGLWCFVMCVAETTEKTPVDAQKGQQQ